MKNKLITYVTVASMLSSACSPQGKSNDHGNEKSAQIIENSSWLKFQALVSSANGNVPLAESLTQLFREQNPDVVMQLRKQIELGQLSLNNETSDAWSLQKRSIIVAGSSASADNELLEKTLNLNLTEVQRSNAFNYQLDIKMAGLVQSLALQNLLKTYDEQIKSDSTDLASDLIQRMDTQRPDLLARIDKTKGTSNRSAQIEQIVIYLKQADFLFLKYGIPDSDVEKLIVYTAVAGTMASALSQTQTVKTLVKAAQEVKELTDKTKRLVGLAKTIKQNSEALSGNAKVMGQSVKTIYGKIKSLSDDLEIGKLELSDTGKDNARALLNDLLNGHAVTEIPKEVSEELKEKGFFERKRELDSDVKLFITSADGAAKSLDQIIGATQEITAALGIKLNPKVTKAMDTAMKISKGIQVANTVATAFSAGGFMGAMAAFSGGPATMALAAFGGGLGGGGPDPAIMAELAGIKQSLNEIKAMQREILENQKKMMVMIKDLALMMEEYHRQQMRKLADIHDEVLNIKEGLTEIDEAAFRSCEAMTSYALNQVPNSIQNLNGSNLDLIKSTIRDVTASPKGLKQFINNGSSSNFETCKKQMSTVFLTKDMLKFNRAAWTEPDSEGKAGRNGGQITREYYLPAYDYLESITLGKEGRWQRMGLHLPVLTASTLLHKKSKYLNQPGNLNTLKELKYLTATNKLEKFISALLILHPYLAINYDTWNSSIADVLTEGMSSEVRELTRQMLVNALERVQISIAQEAVLAGEPLLPSLSKEWNKVVGEKTNCDSFEKEKFCFVRTNSLMMSNLLTYVLVQRLGFGQDNEAAINIRRSSYLTLLADPQVMANLLMIPVGRLEVENGVMYLKLSEVKPEKGNTAFRMAFPDIEVVALGQLQYTEAMARMIVLEHKVSDELVKISSVSKKSNVGLAEALFVK